MEKEIIIRFADIDDLPSIVNIYNQAIRTKGATGDLVEFRVENRITWFEKFNKDEYPLYVAEMEETVVGYCSLSPYRPGRKAMSSVAEISYYLDYSIHGHGVGTALINHAILDCSRIGKKSLLAILLDINIQSVGILKKFNFTQWGHFPKIIEIDGEQCGQVIYGLRIDDF